MKSVADISPLGHGVMSWWLERHQHFVLFWDIPRMTANIDELLAKNTDSNISCVSGKPFSVGSTVEIVVKRGNAATVHVDLDIVCSLSMIVSWRMGTVRPAKPHPAQRAIRSCSVFLRKIQQVQSSHIPSLTLTPGLTL